MEDSNIKETTANRFKGSKCPACGCHKLNLFYEVENVPVHSVLLMPTREKALSYPKGDIVLGLCKDCGFIFNVAFESKMHEYSSQYEETQGFSGTFNAFHKRLAENLIQRYKLHKKDIIEIGCGKGEFLTLLCQLGNNNGVGFDPAFVNGRLNSEVSDQIKFIKDFYSEKYSNYQADFVCCKMTLEHIYDTGRFINVVRRSVGDRKNTVVFFQVPDVNRILGEQAFWDIYYEHCSYFSSGSLSRLFWNNDFAVQNIWTDYDDQYLMIEARPKDGEQDAPKLSENEYDLEAIEKRVADFTSTHQKKLSDWKQTLKSIKENGQRAVIWGGGSKGVAFLTTLQIQDEIQYAVDINPHKHGTFMAGTGQEIVGPEFLTTYKPDVVILMNSIYTEEVRRDLEKLNVNAKLISV